MKSWITIKVLQFDNAENFDCYPRFHIHGAPPSAPPILYRLNFVIRRLYLFGIKKITFIACFLTSDQFLERKAKNYRFLAFRRNFQIHGMGSRSSKMLKISYGRPWKLVNMTNDRINMIFDCGSWSPFIFSYFTSDIMGGAHGGAPVFNDQNNIHFKKSQFLS